MGILGSIAVCACSLIFGGCTLWYICKFRKNKRIRNYSRRSGIVVDHQDAKQMSHSSNSANSNSKSGDGYINEPHNTYNSRGPHNRHKNSEVQYERIESNAENLD